MAYALRYYKELEHTDGTVYRLEIHEKDGTAQAMEIGKVLQALRLDVQGDSEIDAPIVKTSLTMVFVDAPDHAEAGTKKCGNWEEFYTPDATKWQVVMKYRKAGAASFVTMWGGYITPDSYTETLVYRGSVTIVARDNIGHMQDFPFDAEGNADGMISLVDLIEAGWAKIASPMILNVHDHGDNVWMGSEGVRGYETMMNVSAFEGMNWYEAVEAALYAYGAVMRFVGDNWVEVGPLRYLPWYGADRSSQVPTAVPVFLTGAERELSPAVRRIEENLEYDVQDAVSMPPVKPTDFTGAEGEYTCAIDGDTFGRLEHSAPVWPISNMQSGKGWCNKVPNATLFFNPQAYDIGYFSTDYEEEIRRYMYIASNNTDDRVVEFSRYVRCSDLSLRIKFGTPIGLNSSGLIERKTTANLHRIKYAVSIVQDDVEEYYQGGGTWGTAYKELTEEYDYNTSVDTFEAPIGFGEHVGESLLKLHIIKIEYRQIGYVGVAKDGIYACIQSLAVALPSDSSYITTNNINTNYKAENNVILSRDPKIGPALNGVALPALIKNGIFVKSGNMYIPAKTWAWPDGSTPQQMAVYNHLQLLTYHAKPNSIIRGTIVNADLSSVAKIYLWHGIEMMLVSGSLNFVSGHLEGAVLREFARYEDMWGTIDDTALPEVEGDSSTTADGGGSSSSSSGGVTSNTEVYIGGSGGSITLDTYMSDSSTNGVQNRVIKAYVDGKAEDLTADLKALSTLLSSMWHLDEAGNVRTDRNVIIAGDTSSGGTGQDTPSAGLDEEQLQQYLDEHKYVTEDDVAGLIPDVDLSDYYTKSQTNAAISSAIAGIDLSPYATKTEVNTAIANLVNGAPTTLDTLKEIADALAENEDVVDALNTAIGTKANASDLTALATRVSTAEGNITNLTSNKANKATTLAGYGITNAYTKTEIDTKETALKQSVSSVGTRVTVLESWKTDLSKYITIVDGNVKISTNLIVTGDTSSGGSGEDTGASGTVTGIKVNGSTYEPVAGIVTIPDYPTSLTWEAISGKPSFAAVATSGKYSDLSGVPTTLKNPSALSWSGYSSGSYDGSAAKSITIPSNTNQLTNGAGFITGITKSMLDGVLGNASGAGEKKYLMWTGSISVWNAIPTKLSQFTDDVVSGKYLPLTGGTISGTVIYSAAAPAMKLYSAPGVPYLRFGASASSEFGEIGVTSAGDAVFWSLISGNSAYGTWRTLIHSGNIGSQTVSHSSTTNRFKVLLESTSGDLNTALSAGGCARNYNGGLSQYTNAPSGASYGMVLELRGSTASSLAGQLAWDVNHGSTTDVTRMLWWRASDSPNGFKYGKWHQIAFTDSNVASATKLATARTIWGQSFDGTGNVSGSISLGNSAILGGTGVSMLFYDASDTLYLGYGMNGVGGSTICGNAIAMRYGASRAMGFLLNSSGNVTIGSSDLAGTSYKMYVDGHIKSGYYELNTTASNPYLKLSTDKGYSSFVQLLQAGTLCLGSNYTHFAITNGGNIGIGTASPAYKLDVAGTGRFTGAVTMSDQLYLGNNMGVYFKNTSQTNVLAMYVDTYDVLQIGYNNVNSVGFQKPVTMSSTLSVADRINAGPYLFMNSTGEGIYLSNDTLSWHNKGVYNTVMFQFNTTEIVSAKTIRPAYNTNYDLGTNDFMFRYHYVSWVGSKTGSAFVMGANNTNYVLIETSGAMRPYANNSYSLGTNSYMWSGVYTNLLQSAKGLDIVANGGATGSRLSLIANCLRPWGDDAGAIDLGVSNIRWRSIYCGAGNFSVDVVTPFIYGDKPSGASYYRWRIVSDSSSGGVYFQAANYAGTSTAGDMYLTGYNAQTLAKLAIKATTTSISGDATIGGNLIVTGDTSSGSDIRFKDVIEDKRIKIEDIANAPLFTFKWNDREDDVIHLGSSAQYWEKVAPWLVSGEDFKTLNYAVLGVAMGISLAKKAVNHEERIKILEKENDELKERIRRMEYGKVC